MFKKLKQEKGEKEQNENRGTSGTSAVNYKTVCAINTLIRSTKRLKW